MTTLCHDNSYYDHLIIYTHFDHVHSGECGTWGKFDKNMTFDLWMVQYVFSFLARLLRLPTSHQPILLPTMLDQRKDPSSKHQDWIVVVLDRVPEKEWPANGIISATRVGRFKHYAVAWKQSCIRTDCLRRRPEPNTESWRVRILEWRQIDGIEHIVVDWEPTTLRRCAFESTGGRKLLREYRQRARAERMIESNRT